MTGAQHPAPKRHTTKIKKGVGYGQPNLTSDVGAVLGELVARGIYAYRNRQRDSVVKNAGLEGAISEFQTRNGLKVDAVMEPEAAPSHQLSYGKARSFSITYRRG